MKSKLYIIAFRDLSPEMLAEIPVKSTLGGAIKLIADWTGQSEQSVRAFALQKILEDFITTRARVEQYRDRRFRVWIAAQLIRVAIGIVKDKATEQYGITKDTTILAAMVRMGERFAKGGTYEQELNESAGAYARSVYTGSNIIGHAARCADSMNYFEDVLVSLAETRIQAEAGDYTMIRPPIEIIKATEELYRGVIEEAILTFPG